MLKEAIRETYRLKRTNISDVDKNRFDDLMLIHFQSLDLPFVNSILSYWPIAENKEVNTHIFTNYLEFKNPGAVVLYPVASFDDNSMKAVVVNEETEFSKNRHNIYEPVNGEEMPASEIDLILVPLLVTDKEGYRVGYGKGYYDKYMSGCRKGCIKIGLSYFDPIETIEDRNEYDIPLNYLITPQEVHVF